MSGGSALNQGLDALRPASTPRTAYCSLYSERISFSFSLVSGLMDVRERSNGTDRHSKGIPDSLTLGAKLKVGAPGGRRLSNPHRRILTLNGERSKHGYAAGRTTTVFAH